MRTLLVSVLFLAGCHREREQRLLEERAQLTGDLERGMIGSAAADFQNCERDLPPAQLPAFHRETAAALNLNWSGIRGTYLTGGGSHPRRPPGQHPRDAPAP